MEDRMVNAKQVSSYKTVAVDTASPAKLILMLYDGATRFLGTALNGFEQEDVRVRHETVHNNLMKAQNIVLELQRCLNHQDGGEFAMNMFRIYDYMNNQIMEANMKKEPGNIRQVINMIGELREAWEQMMKEQTAASAQPVGLSLSA